MAKAPLKKIPKEDFIAQVVREVIEERGSVQSQEELCFLTLRKLKKYNPKFVLSPRRVKNVALKVKGIVIKAKTKKSPKIDKLVNCPACKKKVRKIYGKNLVNKRIHIGYACDNCGYTTDLESIMPMKYIFLLKRKRK